MDLLIEARRESPPHKTAAPVGVRFDLFFKAYPRPIFIWQQRQETLALVDYNEAGGIYLQDITDTLSSLGESASYLGLLLEDVQRCYQQKTRVKRELPAYRLHSTGEIKDLVLTYAYIEPGYVMQMIKDVTAERAMINQLKRLSSAVEQTADAVFITDKAGNIEYINHAFETLTGYTRREALGHNPRLLKSGHMPEKYYQSLWKTIQDGKPFQGQTINRRKDGSTFTVEQTITPMRDEHGVITHYVSVIKDMTESLRYQEQETEHRLAGRVQAGLFPKRAPQVAGYDIAGAVFPASQTSGDCFDFIRMSADSLGVVVGDVCGHGLGSALIMAETRAYLRSITRFVSDPRLVLCELHDQILDDLANTGFITMFLARLDPRQHLFHYANAGNWPAYILGPHGELVNELRTNGLPIGITAQLELQPTEPVMLEPGSLVLFLTDGIPEAEDESGQPFGIARLLDLVRGLAAQPAAEIIQQVRAEVQRYTGTIEQTDDQTIVICKRDFSGVR